MAQVSAEVHRGLADLIGVARVRRFFLYFSMVFAMGQYTLSQGSARYTVAGIAQDSTGAVVPAIKVNLTSVAGGPVASTTTNANGRFEFRSVAAGSYLLVIPADRGFALRQMPVTAGTASASLTITLSPESATQTAVVTDQPDISVETTANQDAVNVAGDSLEHLPVFDQDYIAALTPFLDPASSDSNGVTILVNGMEVKASTISPSAIGEVRINDDPYSAEFARPGRGRINIIPKPGSPEFHGTLNLIARDAVFNASNYFATTKPPEQRRIYEGSVSGPLGKGGHTLFMLNGNRRETDTDAAIYAYEPTGIVTGNTPTPSRDNNVSSSITHDFSDAHRISFGYNFEYETDTNTGVGGLVLPEAGVNWVYREDDAVFSDRLIFTPNLLEQLQMFFEKDEWPSTSVTEGPSVQVAGAFTGGSAQADAEHTENTVHITDVVSWTHGRLYVRFGANIPQISRRAIDDHTNRLGTFSFASLADYENAQPYLWSAQQGPGRAIYWINEIGTYAQDEVTLKPNLRLTLGLRYQWETYIDDVKNFAPRISTAWSPNHLTVVRAGIGMFYDRFGGDTMSRFKTNNGVVLHSVQVVNPGYPTPVPAGTNLQSQPPSIVLPSATLHTPYTFQYSVDVERQIGKAVTLTTSYSGILGVSQFRSRDANAPLPPGYTVLPNPSLGFVQQVESGGRKVSNALEITVKARTNPWLTGQAKYTLSRSRDNAGGINWYPQDQYNPNNEWGRSNYDRLNRFNMIGNVHPDHWLTLGISATVYSAAPYNETAGTDSYQTGLGNTRPAGVERNTLEGGATTDFDLLWDHNFKLDKKKSDGKTLNLGVSAFNVMNHPNFANYVGNVQSPIFGQPTTANAGRQMQFGMRYSF